MKNSERVTLALLDQLHLQNVSTINITNPVWQTRTYAIYDLRPLTC